MTPPALVPFSGLIPMNRLQNKWKCDVKYDLLENESEAKPFNKKIWALKLFYFIALVCVFACIFFIYCQDFAKAPNAKVIPQNLESNVSDLPANPAPSTHVPLLLQPHIHSTSTGPLTPHVHPTSTAPPNSCGVRLKEGPVIKVGGLNTYVIGSYVEHRFGEKMIKTIAIVLRQEPAKYSCLMCCEGRNVTSTAETVIHYDHFDFEYGTASIMCPIDRTCRTPTHLALTSSAFSGSITSFQTIRNRDIPTTFPFDFTICISVMYDYKNVLNLVQAMEMFRLLGAQRVVIYRTNCDSNIQKVLDYYVDQGLVEIIPWTIKQYITVSSGWRKHDSPGQLHYYGQIPALNDCVYRYMYQSRYVALQDLDELILPLKMKTWGELLPELEKKYGAKVGFEFENNQFPLNAKAHAEYDIEKWKHVQGANILNYIERVPNIPNAFNNFKVIVNPRLAVKVTVHGLLETVSSEGPSVRVDNSVARMYHLKNFAYPPNTNLITDNHLWDYAKDLIPAVSKVLQDCGFIEA